LVACGGDGVISVAANAFPAKFSDLIRLSLKGDFPKASALLLELTEGIDLMFAENNPAGVKAFLTTYKVIQNYLRLPVVPVSQPIMEAIEAFAPTVVS
jgi:4-hydroxy-tetrahydrodipicolinate synthase